MRRLVIAGVLALVLVGGVVAPAAAAPGGWKKDGAPVYLALGDSVAAGVGAPAEAGYVALLGTLLDQGYDPAADEATRHPSVDFRVVNRAVGGATTATLIAHQLPAALDLIEGRRRDRDPRNDVEVVTVTIGGNDVFGPVVAACLGATPTNCQQAVDTALGGAEAGLTTILGELVDAAGRRAEVVVTTYYNPITPPCPLSANPAAVDVADAVLEGGSLPGLSVGDGLNDRIRRAAATARAQVTDLYGALDSDDLAGDCLHPDASGHREIADQAYATIAR